MRRLQVARSYLSAYLISLLAVAGMLILLVWIGRVDSAAVERYLRLQQTAQPTYSSSKVSKASSSMHERLGMRRDLLHHQPDPQLAIRLHADRVLLTLSKEEEGHQLMEELTQVNAWIQEEIAASDQESFYTQQLRHIKAEKAFYAYHDDLLNAQDVWLEEGTLPGSQLPESFALFKPIYQLKAAYVELPLRSKEHNWQAKEIEGSMHMQQVGSL